MNILDAISVLDKDITNPSKGLPDEVFYYISRMTPLVNVDLLIKDENERILLAWRDDQYSGKGWHVLGGIVRFKETLETRIQKVAETEIGVDVKFDTTPVTVKQVIHHGRETRSHFISLLYNCFLSETFIPENKGLTSRDPGYLQWHDSSPDDLLKCHKMYLEYF